MKFISEEELLKLAKKVREDKGLTQVQVGKQLGVAQATIAQAENDPTRSLSKLRLKIITEFSELRVEGPFYKIIEP